MSAQFDTIIITSDEPFSDTWHTQLIYAQYLSSHFNVLFVNPPKKWKFSNLFNFNQNEKIISDGLVCVDYKNVFPVIAPLFSNFNEWLNCSLIKKKLKQKKVQSILIWHFDSFRSCFNSNDFIKEFKIKRIYHVIDPFMKNPQNELLSVLANKIVITSPRNNNYYVSYADKVVNIPQVINTELCRRLVKGSVPVDIKFKDNFSVLLGTISDDLDFKWIEQFASEPTINLIIIGKAIKLKKNKEAFEVLISKPNISYLGEMPPEKFYPIIAKAKSGLVIYNLQKQGQVSSPLKAINYLIANIPTITNVDCEIETLNQECIYTTNDIEKFQTYISRANENKLPFNATLANTYLNSISIEKAVNTLLSSI